MISTISVLSILYLCRQCSKLLLVQQHYPNFFVSYWLVFHTFLTIKNSFLFNINLLFRYSNLKFLFTWKKSSSSYFRQTKPTLSLTGFTCCPFISPTILVMNVLKIVETFVQDLPFPLCFNLILK